MKNPVRKSTRIPCFDYSGDHYYFVTICTNGMNCIFGSIEKHSVYGIIAKEAIQDIESSGIKVDKFVIMPNHIHMILVIGCGESENKKLDTVIGLYKSGVSRRIHKIDPSVIVWQRSFHDHVIRNRLDYENIWTYIDGNPLKWKEDRFYMQ